MKTRTEKEIDRLKDEEFDFFPLPIRSSYECNNVILTINYQWIIKQLDKKLGKCPENVKTALIELEKEQD